MKVPRANDDVRLSIVFAGVRHFLSRPRGLTLIFFLIIIQVYGVLVQAESAAEKIQKDKNAFLILGVSESSRPDEVKKQFKSLMQKFGSDKFHEGPERDAVEVEQKKVSEARWRLYDKLFRRRSDETNRLEQSAYAGTFFNETPREKPEPWPGKEQGNNFLAYQMIVKATGIGNDSTQAAARLFSSDNQLEALRIGIKARHKLVLRDLAKLARFETSLSVRALGASSIYHHATLDEDYDFLLKFRTEAQVKALEIAATARKGLVAEIDYSKLLLIRNVFQLEALRTIAHMAGPEIDHFYDQILLFDNQELLDSLNDHVSDSNPVQFELGNILDSYLLKLSHRYDQVLEATWEAVEAFVGSPQFVHLLLEPHGLEIFQKYVQSGLPKFEGADPAFSLNRIEHLTERMGLPARALLGWVIGHRTEIFINDEKSRVFNGRDLLASPLAKSGYFKDPESYRALINFFENEGPWLRNLSMNNDEVQAVLKLEVLNRKNSPKLEKIRMDLAKSKVRQFDTLETYQNFLKGTGLEGLFDQTYDHFSSLPKTLDDINTVIRFDSKNLSPEHLEKLVVLALRNATSVEGLYSIPVTKKYLKYHNLLQFYRLRNRAVGGRALALLVYPNHTKSNLLNCSDVMGLRSQSENTNRN